MEKEAYKLIESYTHVDFEQMDREELVDNFKLLVDEVIDLVTAPLHNKIIHLETQLQQAQQAGVNKVDNALERVYQEVVSYHTRPDQPETIDDLLDRLMDYILKLQKENNSSNV